MSPIKILVVDDESMNLDIIGEYLEGENYHLTFAGDGLEAWEVLNSEQNFDLLLLDRMMPRLDGMELVAKIRAVDRFNDLPIIMQTAASSQSQVSEGLRAGVFYYLSKPYTKEVLAAVVKAANEDKKSRDELKRMIREYGYALGMIEAGRFRFRTLDDAKSLAALIGSGLRDPGLNIIGLTEILLNAVEHGNYGITYEQKRDWKLQDRWDIEYQRVASKPENLNKFGTLTIQKFPDHFIIKIKDMGEGFDYRPYLSFSPDRLTDPNGRGILMIMNSGFDQVDFLGNGNEIMVKIGFAANS